MLSSSKLVRYHAPHQPKLTDRFPRNHLPLIAVPRLLKTNDPAHRSSNHSYSPESQLCEVRPGSAEEARQESVKEIKRLNSLSILDFPPELIASSLVDLWEDLASEDSRHDFLLYQRGWIGHVVLLGCFNSTGPEVIERVIEVACCLDLLCQVHDIAVTVIKSIQVNAVMRMTAWQRVLPSLIHKMKEILEKSLAADVQPSTVFRAPRDASLEYWILSRPYVDDEHLLAESLAIEPQCNQVNDVETRITQLEALLVTMDHESIKLHHLPNSEINGDSEEPELSEIDQLTGTDMESSILSSSDMELEHDGINSARNAAQQTRIRVIQRLESLKNSVHLKNTRQQETRLEGSEFSIPSYSNTTRLFDPLDQRAIFRTRAPTEQISVHRRLRPKATYSVEQTTAEAH